LEYLKKSGIDYAYLEKEKSASGKISVSTMHSAKGLEYRIVLIIACDSNVIPKSSRLEKAGDESELEEIYATERQLLYVACTRARDLIRTTGLKPGSEFLEDMMG
jgi:superfamily I DNA/RNA helicase